MLFFLAIRWAAATVLVVVAIGYIVLAACNGPVKFTAPKCEPVKVTVPPSPAPGASPYCLV